MPDGLNLRDYLDGLLDDTQPLQRHFEQEATGSFTPEQAAMCFARI